MNFRIWTAAALMLALAACAKKPTAPVVVAPAAPTATSPTGLVQRLAWALQARDHVAYADLFTDDYQFVFALNDSAGYAFRASRFDLALEEASALHMLSGGGATPPVKDIKVVISDQLVAQPDPRLGRSLLWHKSVRTPISIQVTYDDNGSPAVTSIHGYAMFYAVRGDSAVFGPDRAAERDSTRWFVSRWEDETAGAGGAPGTHVNPARNATLGMLKVHYLPPAVAAP